MNQYINLFLYHKKLQLSTNRRRSA